MCTVENLQPSGLVTFDGSLLSGSKRLYTKWVELSPFYEIKTENRQKLYHEIRARPEMYRPKNLTGRPNAAKIYRTTYTFAIKDSSLMNNAS